MRVISGTAGGRRLQSVPGDGTRPISDRVKTALFNILQPTIEGLSVLDLFAGSGGVGIEALSRGAASCVFTDISKKATDTIRANLELTELTSQSEVRTTDAFWYLRHATKSFDLIYVAPPQYKGVWLEAMQTIGERPEIVTPTGSVIVQIDKREYEDLSLAAFKQTDRRDYGDTTLLFYDREAKL